MEKQKSNRKCGSCRECCIVLEVDALAKRENQPCAHLCKKGCGIYEDRPLSCETFTCAWLEGAMSTFDKPSRTHMVCWGTNMIGPGGIEIEVIQCNVRNGVKMNYKTLRWLTQASFKIPVVVVQNDQGALLSHGKQVGDWKRGQFIRFEFAANGAIEKIEAVPYEDALTTPEAVDGWNKEIKSSCKVVETDEFYRDTQLQYLEQKS